MARNVHEVNITGWHDESNTVPVPQWSVDVEVKWTDDNGDFHTHNGNYSFPNVLGDFPVAAVRQLMETAIMAKVRVDLGINTWSDFQ